MTGKLSKEKLREIRVSIYSLGFEGLLTSRESLAIHKRYFKLIKEMGFTTSDVEFDEKDFNKLYDKTI